jgi:hypothetical protein
MGHMAERFEVQRAVAASPDEIFAVLSDPRGHVAIDSSGMLMEASGDMVAKVGDTFVVHMDREAGGRKVNLSGAGPVNMVAGGTTFSTELEVSATVLECYYGTKQP